jgi:DNA processing protein
MTEAEKKESIQALLALKATDKIGPVTIKNLVAYCGSPIQVLKTTKGKLLKIPEVGEKTAAMVVQATKHLANAEKELNWAEKQKIRVWSYLDAEYPDMLRHIPDLPVVLFSKGRLLPGEKTGIAVVGTRKPTEYGKKTAIELSAKLAEAGVNIVSGLAYGIDYEAHRATVKHNGITTAVLGHGLDRIYPAKHTLLSEKIIESGGCLLTEYPSGTNPDAVNFPSRNRIVAGLCKATIVIEAASTGGALITARQAFDYDREVYAVPGNLDSPFSEGCNRLIKDNIARIFTTVQDLFTDLGLQESGLPTPDGFKEKSKSLPPLSGDEHSIVEALRNGSLLIDLIAEKTGIPFSRLNAVLLALEFKGIIQQFPGKKFKLS